MSVLAILLDSEKIRNGILHLAFSYPQLPASLVLFSAEKYGQLKQKYRLQHFLLSHFVLATTTAL